MWCSPRVYLTCSYFKKLCRNWSYSLSSEEPSLETRSFQFISLQRISSELVWVTVSRACFHLFLTPVDACLFKFIWHPNTINEKRAFDTVNWFSHIHAVVSPFPCTSGEPEQCDIWGSVSGGAENWNPLGWYPMSIAKRLTDVLKHRSTAFELL
jgi:hypothetical protein